jgi:transcriptional regulator with XRE-family HTH domain
VTSLNRYANLFREARSKVEYWTELSIIEFTAGLRHVMGRMTQTELAGKMNVSDTYVSNVLRGQDNLTIDQMNRIASFLDAAVHIHVAKRDRIVTWHEEGLPMTAHSAGSDDAVESNESTGSAQLLYGHDSLPVVYYTM